MLGSMVGRFRLDWVIASGGMGTVYRATQLQPVRRTVAIKMIRAGMADAATTHRFHAERQALALMDHPDIAQVYEADSAARGQPYFAMEFCKGLPIDQYCDEHCLDLSQRVRLVIRIARAVQRAHSLGVIHRDLKPSNVLVDHGDGQPTLKVIDFGIAKFTDEQWREVGGDATRVGELIGTPAYMSPEQGRGETIDPRTDVFAIGAILFRLLTGTIANLSLNVKGSSVAEIVSQVQQFDPVKPSKRLADRPAKNRELAAQRAGLATGSRLLTSIRGDLDWVTVKAVQPNRVDRYATADDLADDLQRFLDHRPVLAHAPSIAYRLRKHYQRRRAIFLGSTAVIATVLSAAVLGGIGRWNRQQTRLATLDRVSVQIDSLVDQSDAARRRAGASGANSQAEFVTARTALAKVESLLQSYPSLTTQKRESEDVNCSLQHDLDAFTLVADLNDARERATQIDADHHSDAFGRVAGLRMMTEAFQRFGITPAESAPTHTADRLRQCPPALHHKLIESLDFMITETPLGAGIYLHEQGGRITIAHLVHEGPAQRSGKLQVGDRILAIDGHDLVDSWQPTVTRTAAYRKLHRKPGETVQLTIVTGLADPVTVKMTCNGDAAHWALEVLKQLDPDSFRMRLREAMLAADLAALQSLAGSDALRSQPPFTLIGLSGMLFLLDRSNDAIDYLRLAQRRHPENFWANHYLGTALAVAHDPPRPQQSLQFLTAAVALRPNSVGARMNLAGALVRSGQIAAATEHVRVAEELAPESETILWNLDWMQRIQPESLAERPTRPATSSTAASRTDGPAPTVVNAPAVGTLDSYDDDSIDQWQARARRFAAAGKRQEAMRALRLAEQKFAGDPRLRRARGAVLVDLQDYTAARVVLSDAARLLPHDAGARFYYGVALQYCGDSEAAIHEYRAALAIRPDYAAVHAFLDPLVDTAP
jgi:serine/threonine protein kinase/tetratricopeptide (TPR) repeat protein